MFKGKANDASHDSEGVLRIKGHMCVPRISHLTKLIMEDTHSSSYSIHSWDTKMYWNLKQYYWWYRIKRDIVDFVSRGFNYPHEKCEHQRP